MKKLKQFFTEKYKGVFFSTDKVCRYQQEDEPCCEDWFYASLAWCLLLRRAVALS
jgi:hypothetical protein